VQAAKAVGVHQLLLYLVTKDCESCLYAGVLPRNVNVVLALLKAARSEDMLSDVLMQTSWCKISCLHFFTEA
jgi:hypothetical protein